MVYENPTLSPDSSKETRASWLPGDRCDPPQDPPQTSSLHLWGFLFSHYSIQVWPVSPLHPMNSK